MDKKIIMLVGRGQSARFMYNGIKDTFNIEHIVITGNKVGGSKKKFLKRRIKRLGYIEVFGQVLFQGICVKLLRKTSKKRVQDLKTQLGLSFEEYPKEKLIDVGPVNSDVSLETLKKINPDVIIVNGTAIIKKKILDALNATIVNTHAGITPRYRGVHGGYWALANKDQAHCGVTVHLVDQGIDTGNIVYQDTIEITKQDNFITYPYLQIAKGIELMKQTLSDILEGTLKTTKSTGKSKLWYHPTIWKYLYCRVFRGVK